MPDLFVPISDQCHDYLAQLARQEGISIPVLVNNILATYCAQSLPHLAVQLTVLDESASKEAEQALQRDDRLAMLGNMAATFSHDVRNPLQSLRLYTEILEEAVAACAPDTAAASRQTIDYALTVIREEATRMSNIVQDYLSLARLDVPSRDPEDFGGHRP